MSSKNLRLLSKPSDPLDADSTRVQKVLRYRLEALVNLVTKACRSSAVK